MKKIPTLLFILIIFTSCNKSTLEKRCAFIHIYNPKTEHETMSDLYVEVKDNKVVKIYWDNGGWLDESHFNPDEAYLDSNGYTSFDDDRGRDFGVTLQDKSQCEYWND